MVLSVDLVPIDASNIRSVKKLHAGIFPVLYSNKFFEQILNNDLCAAIMFNEMCVGVVCCKFEMVGCTETLYIMSLGVHPLYRCRGIGAELVNFAISKAISHCVSVIRLHVQISNFNAIDFYSKRGFSIVETAHNYYHRCTPADAHVMHKLL
nr:GCN5-related N-acetyltransferase domain containing protein [Haemonchus contortus]